MRKTKGGQSFGVVSRVARQLGAGRERLRAWLRQAQIHSGKRAGTSTAGRFSSWPCRRSPLGKCDNRTGTLTRSREVSEGTSTLSNNGLTD